ncbi:MAG: hypothetical protein FJY11_03545 [Bacteroidetes bacterium]|nr:hypothetical protein [Bacteroidota bacterium]
MKKQTLLTVLLAAVYVVANAQTSVIRPDKYTLLTMPYNQRQLTLYKGQVQANAGYKFSVMARQFSSAGDLEVLRNMGIASVYHYYFAEMKYGVAPFLEVGAMTNFMKRGVRSQTVTYVSADETVKVNNLTEEKGMGDLLLTATLRLPVEFRIADISAGAGLLIPSAKHEPEKPTHTVSNVLSESSYTVNYQYHNTIGNGVPVYLFSANAKITLSGFTLATSFLMKDPVREGENFRWNQNLTANRTFDYSTSTYKFLPDRSFEIGTALHFQATGWLNAFMNLGYMNSGGGWTEYWGKRYRNPDRWMISLEPGLEIQVSPAVTIYQKAGFPLSGKNTYAPFYMYITASFNTFAFYR